MQRFNPQTGRFEQWDGSSNSWSNLPSWQGGNASNSNFNFGNSGNSGNSGSGNRYLDMQRQESDENRRLALADRDRAANLLASFLGERRARGPEGSIEYDTTRRAGILDGLMADPRDTEFAQSLMGRLQSIMDNPEVVSQEQQQALVDSNRERIASELRAQQAVSQASAANRGVGTSGMSDSQTQQLNQQALANALGVESDVAVQASQLEADNLMRALSTGTSFEQALAAELGDRLTSAGNLQAGFESNDINAQAEMLRNALGNEQLDANILGRLSDVYANTQYQNPDYSGYAAMDAQRDLSQQNYELQMAELEQMARQMEINARLGIADLELQRQFENAAISIQELQLEQASKQTDWEGNTVGWNDYRLNSLKAKPFDFSEVLEGL